MHTSILSDSSFNCVRVVVIVNNPKENKRSTGRDEANVLKTSLAIQSNDR